MVLPVDLSHDLNEVNTQQFQLTSEMHSNTKEKAIARALSYEQQERL